MNGIVARINELRVKSGLSKAALAEKVGVTPTTIGNWSKKDSVPTLAVIERICEATGITIEQFFGGMRDESEIKPEDKFLDEWRMLTKTEKAAIDMVMDAFIELKK